MLPFSFKSQLKKAKEIVYQRLFEFPIRTEGELSFILQLNHIEPIGVYIPSYRKYFKEMMKEDKRLRRRVGENIIYYLGGPNDS